MKLRKAPENFFPCTGERIVETNPLGEPTKVEITRFRVAGSTQVAEIADALLALHTTVANTQPNGQIPNESTAEGERGFYTVTHALTGAAFRKKIPGLKLARRYLELLEAGLRDQNVSLKPLENYFTGKGRDGRLRTNKSDEFKAYMKKLGAIASNAFDDAVAEQVKAQAAEAIAKADAAEAQK